MKIALIMSTCLVLTGCVTATSQKYDAILNNWLNQPEVALVSSWGAPDNVYITDGKKFISYYSQHNTYLARSSFRYQPFYAGSWPYYDPIDDVSYQVIAKICKTTFTVEKEIITKWSHRGDGCIAE